MKPDANNAPEISVVIVNWNSVGFLEKCLATVFADRSVKNLQVIVVDGGSFDGCDHFIAENFPQVTFIQATENIGFARSNNLAIPHIQAPYVALLNPDTEIEKGTWKAMIDCYTTLENPGILGPKLLNTDGTHQTSCVQALPTPLNQTLDSNFLREMLPKLSLWGTYKAYNSKEPTPVEALSGAFMFIESALFKSLGGFEESFFMYAEDMDLSKRVSDQGCINYYLPHITTLHHGGGSSSTEPSAFSIKAMCTSLNHYLTIHHGENVSARYRRGMLLSSVSRLLTLKITSLLSIPFPAKRAKLTNSIHKWSTIYRWCRSL